MKARTQIALLLMSISVWLVPAWPGSADPDSEEKKPVKREGPRPEAPRERGGGGGMDPLRNLTPEERDKFREAMRQAWSDPAVLQARDEVKEATVAYQRALIETIKRNDPEVMALMKKIQAVPDSPIKHLFSGGGGPGGRGRPGGSGFRDFEAFITGESPGFLKNLSDEQKDIYRQAREKALQSPEFQEVIGKLRELRNTDEKMRNQRIEYFGRVRQTLNAQIIKADERVKEFLPKEEFHPKGPPPAGRRIPGNGGKGPDRKRLEGKSGDSPDRPRKEKEKE